MIVAVMARSVSQKGFDFEKLVISINPNSSKPTADWPGYQNQALI